MTTPCLFKNLPKAAKDVILAALELSANIRDAEQDVDEDGNVLNDVQDLRDALEKIVI